MSCHLPMVRHVRGIVSIIVNDAWLCQHVEAKPFHHAIEREQSLHARHTDMMARHVLRQEATYPPCPGS